MLELLVAWYFISKEPMQFGPMPDLKTCNEMRQQVGERLARRSAPYSIFEVEKGWRSFVTECWRS